MTADGRPIHDEDTKCSGIADEAWMGNFFEEQAMQFLPFSRSLQCFLSLSKRFVDPPEPRFSARPVPVPPLSIPKSKDWGLRLRDRYRCWSLIV